MVLGVSLRSNRARIQGEEGGWSGDPAGEGD